jgi:hypothetical protein
MSYSRTYSGTVHYSGYQSYSHSYPASEHGGTVSGTVHYSGEVPVSVNLYVDTNPFDSSVNSCSNSVKKLNGAVISMNSAQVASIAKSANDISSHVITGFFNMISSELSQNMAALLSKFKAVFELLTTKATILEEQQVIMQDDYSRIADRYSKIFQNLDEELEKRIIALDKNVFEISKRVQGEQLHSETSKKVTQFLIGVNEDEIVQQQLIVANAKSRVLQAINGLATNIVQETSYSNKVNSIIIEKKCDSGEHSYIPVIYTESENLNSNMIDSNCFYNSKFNSISNKINEAVKNHFVSNYSANDNENEMKQINDAFTLIAEREFQDLKDEKSIRVYEMLKKLKENQ